MANRTQPRTDERAFAFLRMNERHLKPRTQGVTEIRGPYYSPLGKRHLQDVLETMGTYVDALKFAGGSFSLMPRKALMELISLCHEHNVLVSTGGFIEHVLTQGPEAVNSHCCDQRMESTGHQLSQGPRHIPANKTIRGHR
jgi:phosphosulfolactate synthase (CoM biosynthesis protein A)